MKHLDISIVGSGWLGLPLSARLAARGYSVRASTTTSAKQHLIEAAGAVPHRLDLDRLVATRDIATFFGADVVVFTVPPSGTDDYAAAADAVRVRAEESGARWLLMTSSTSVYPDLCRTVVEADAGSQPGYPLQRNGEAVLATESVFRGSSRLGATILRLAGLYGYGRHPALYLAGRQNVPDGDAPVNLVHRDDVVGAIEAVLDAGVREATFNVCADRHPRRRDYYPAAARALGLEPPTFGNTPTGTWKRVSNAHLKESLGFVLSYPDPFDPAP
jgi:nucleoside-diphosphate-sugar epimerase